MARSLLLYLLSMPPDWEVNVKHLTSVFPEGRDVIYKGLAELEHFGYYKAVGLRDDLGRLRGRKTYVCDVPWAWEDAAAQDGESSQVTTTSWNTGYGESGYGESGSGNPGRIERTQCTKYTTKKVVGLRPTSPDASLQGVGRPSPGVDMGRKQLDQDPPPGDFMAYQESEGLKNRGVGNDTTPGENSATDHEATPSRAAPGRQLSRGSRIPPPDSPLGLAWYFREAVSGQPWACPDPANLGALQSFFAKLMRQENFTPEIIRHTIDHYVNDHRLHTDRVVVPWKDFLAKRAQLINGARNVQAGERYRALHAQAVEEEIELGWDDFTGLKSA